MTQTESNFDSLTHSRANLDERLSRPVRAANLRPGDLVDLSNDAYAQAEALDNVTRKENYQGSEFVDGLEFELAPVTGVEQETPRCVLVRTEGFGAFGFPTDHEIPRPRRADRKAPGEWDGPDLVYSDLSSLVRKAQGRFTLRWTHPQTTEPAPITAVQIRKDPGTAITVEHYDGVDDVPTYPGKFRHFGRALEYAERLLIAFPDP